MTNEQKRDDVLLRMLKTPPRKRAPKSTAGRDTNDPSRELNKGESVDLDKANSEE